MPNASSNRRDRPRQPGEECAALPTAAATEDDTTLVSCHLTGRGPWLDPAEPVPTSHLIRAAAELGRSVHAIAERLTELGFQPAEDPTTLPTTPLTHSDTTLISCDLDGQEPWLDPADPVPTIHLIAAAATLGRSVHAIAERLTELGLQPAEDPTTLPTTPLAEDDTTLISRDVDGVGPWLEPFESVSTIHLVRAAAEVGRSVRAVAERLTELGFELAADPATLPTTPVTRSDTTLISHRLNGWEPWLDPGEPVPTSHLIAAAATLGRSVHAIAERLTELGLPLAADPATLPTTSVTDDDITLISLRLMGRGLWLDPTEPVPTSHLIAAAATLGRSVHAIAERLTELGFQPAKELAALPTTAVTRDDTTLISRDVDGREPWLDPTEPVPTSHLIRAAAKLGGSVRTVAERLTDLGFAPTEDPTTLPTTPVTKDDTTLISHRLNGWGPWLEPGEPIPTSHLIRAAATLGHSMRTVAERLTDLGFPPTQDPTTLPTTPLTRSDTTLISRDLNGRWPWLDPTEPIPTVHLIRAAATLGHDVHAIAERLTDLGFQPPQQLSTTRPGQRRSSTG